MAVSDIEKNAALVARVQGIKVATPDAWIILIANKKLRTETAQQLKPSGTRSILLEDDYLHS